MPIETQEEVEYCKLQVHYVAEQEIIKEKHSEAISVFSKHPVPGFRTGKATSSAIYIKYRKQVDDHMRRELISQAYDDVLFETGITPLGYPQTTNVRLSGKSNFSCDMLFTKKPDFELSKYTDLEIPKPHIEKTAVEIAELMMQQLREQMGDVAPYGENDFVQTGDSVTLSYEMYRKDADTVAKEGEFYKVGSNKFTRDFDDGLMGMIPDEEREFNIDLSGDKVKVKVKLHMGMKTVPCSDNEELAKKTNQESYEKLREAVAGSATNKISQEETTLVGEKIKLKLIETHDFEAPSWLTIMEGQNIALQEGIKWEDLEDEARESYLKRAEGRVKLSFILDSIRKKEAEAQMTDEEVRNYLARVIQMRGGDPQQALVEAEKSGKLFGMVASVRDQATMEWLVKKNKVVE